MDNVYMVAILTPREGKLDEVKAGMAQMAEKVEAEEQGCLSYGLFTDKENKKVIVFEKYKDAAALEAHSKTAHMQEAMSKSKENLEEGTQFLVLTPFGGFQRS